ncbi:MAG: DnaT-like ssDNA-binding protein [Armatimonadota bacterium]
MTITVEDGTGVEGADSYVTVSEADEYIDAWHGSTDWGELIEAEKERALRHAVRYIDSHRLAGWQTNYAQRRAFPRTGILRDVAPAAYMDADSPGLAGQIAAEPDTTWYWPADEIPEQVKEAQMEAALRHAQGDDLLPDHDGGTIASESKKVGSLQKQTQYRQPRGAVKSREAIRALLQPFLSSSGGSGSLARSIA